jgi:transposase
VGASFGTFTQGLLVLAYWLKECEIRTMAMEATGVYWIPLFQNLEERGLEVCLVNARHAKNVPGRKSVAATPPRYRSAPGLLPSPTGSSNHPHSATPPIQSGQDGRLPRATDAEGPDSNEPPVAPVISDITGQTGLATLDAVLAGERDPEVLAQLRHPGIKAPQRDADSQDAPPAAATRKRTVRGEPPRNEVERPDLVA